MTAILKAQESMGDPAQEPPAAAETALERQVSVLRQRLKSAERQAASESIAHEDQAKLAETMARAARGEAREREALACANAELSALVRSMENELAALKAEHAATPEPAREPECEDEQAVVPPDDAGPLVPSAREDGEAPSGLRRITIRMPHMAVAGLCLAAVGFGAILYPAVTAFLDDRAETLMGHVTVVKGDTLRIDGTTVRLLGIDAPPVGTEAGARATRYIGQLTAGQDVRCESDGRRAGAGVQARCFIGAVDIGQIMLLSGNAVLRQSALREDYRR